MNRMNRRAGISLIEMLIVISVMSITLGLAVMTIGFLMRAESGATQAFAASNMLSRLAADFRRDARAAREAEIGADDEPGELRLILPEGRTVIYRGNGRSVERLVRQEEKLRQREVYRLGSERIEFQVTEEEPRLASLSVTTRLKAVTNTEGAPAGTRVVRIEAVLGRDRRFEREQTAGEDGNED